jgi:hypothetical protein
LKKKIEFARTGIETSLLCLPPEGLKGIGRGIWGAVTLLTFWSEGELEMEMSKF